MTSVPTFQTTPLNRARNASEALYSHLWDNLRAAWPMFLGPTGSVVRDVAPGGHNDGTLDNIEFDDWKLDEGAYAIELDGVDEEILIDEPEIGTSPFTLMLWIKRVSIGSRRECFDGISGAQEFSLFIHPTNFLTIYTADGAGNTTITGNSLTITAGVWHLLAATRSGAGKLTVWVDGEEDRSTVGAIRDVTSGGQWRLGSSRGTSRFFDGFMDDPKIYLRDFSSNEMRQTWQLGRGGWMAKRRRVLAKAPAAPPVGGVLVHPGMTGGIPVLTGGMRG